MHCWTWHSRAARLQGICASMSMDGCDQCSGPGRTSFAKCSDPLSVITTLCVGERAGGGGRAVGSSWGGRAVRHAQAPRSGKRSVEALVPMTRRLLSVTAPLALLIVWCSHAGHERVPELEHDVQQHQRGRGAAPRLLRYRCRWWV